jgi:hypothetical protein
MNKILMVSAAALALSLGACTGNAGNDRSGMSTGSVHGGDYTASGSRLGGIATAGQGDFNANTNGVNSTGGFSASSGNGLEGTGASSGH